QPSTDCARRASTRTGPLAGRPTHPRHRRAKVRAGLDRDLPRERRAGPGDRGGRRGPRYPIRHRPGRGRDRRGGTSTGAASPSSSARTAAGRSALTTVEHVDTFWFAWAAFLPETHIAKI